MLTRSPGRARSKIAFGATINPDLIQGTTSDIYVLNLTNDSVTKLVSQPGPDSNPRWSPDGKQIVFSTAMGNTVYFASNIRLAVVSADGGTPRSITENFDENPNVVDWRSDGIYLVGYKRPLRICPLDPATGKVTRVSSPDGLMAGGFSLSRDGRVLAFSARRLLR